MRPFQALRMRSPVTGGGGGGTVDTNALVAIYVTEDPPRDWVSGNVLTPAGNAYGDTTAEKMVFDGTGDWFILPSSAAIDPTTNWTLEFWASFTSPGGMVSRAGAGAVRYLVSSNSPAMDFWFVNYSNLAAMMTGGTGGSTMTHYAIVRDGGTWRLYVGGVQVASQASALAPSAGSADLYLGTDIFDPTNRDIAGSLGGLVISNIARYPSGTTFTPPALTSHLLLIPWVKAAVTGTQSVGQTLTLTSSDNGTSRTYQWKRDGVNIAGETATTHTVVSGDIGHLITCAVTATNAYGSKTAVSNVADPIRSSSLLYVNNIGSGGVVFTFPVDWAVGDDVVLCAPHGYSASTPSGWASRNNLAGSNYNGAVFEKSLSSGDIATGSVTITFAGNYYGTIMGVAFIGGTSGFRDIGASRNGSGAASRTVTSGGAVQAGDYLLLFGSARVNAAATSSSLARTLASNTALESSAIARFGFATAAGAQSGTINYAGSPSGDYQAIVAIAP